MKKYRFEIIIFIVDAICMILELVASRLLSPYFGNSNVIWTSVIGIILLSSSIGNYLGGKIADSKNKELSLNSLSLLHLKLINLIIASKRHNNIGIICIIIRIIILDLIHSPIIEEYTLLKQNT